ncbi:MAG: hypothetical protein ACFB9N_01290 [Geitlerinemataceae cyanobacterium]
MSTRNEKIIFSLRIGKGLKEKLHHVADEQGTTITSLINRYITRGLRQDELAEFSDELPAHVYSPSVAVPVSAKSSLSDEVLRQILKSQLDSQDVLAVIKERLVEVASVVLQAQDTASENSENLEKASTKR